MEASAAESLACRQAFGDYEEDGIRDTRLLDNTTDRVGAMRLAARIGYLRWLFRPVKGGLWEAQNEQDDTLNADGGRHPPCPVLPAPRRPSGRGRTVYRLGDEHSAYVLKRFVTKSVSSPP